VRPARDDLVPGDGRAAADDAVDGEDRPGDPVQVADVFRDHLREDADVARVAERTATTSGTARMAGSVWLTHRDMNATSSQPRARRSRRWRKGLNAPSPARCRSRAWTARNPARASRPASVKAGWIVGSRAKRNRVGCTAAPEQLAGLPVSPAWSGRSAFVHAEMAQLWLLPDVLVRLAGDGGGAPPGWSGGKRYGPSGLFATERGACPQHPDRRWRVRHNPC